MQSGPFGPLSSLVSEGGFEGKCFSVVNGFERFHGLRHHGYPVRFNQSEKIGLIEGEVVLER